MGRITKIEAQNRRGRYNVYLDGQYAFPVAESVLVKFRLMKGLELDKKQVTAITTADQQARFYSKMRTESDILKKLHDLETPEQFIGPILQKLRDQHLVDDHEYAASYVRTAMITSLKGPGVIRQHLRMKKIGENDIDDALAQFTPEQQQVNAAKLAEKLFRRYHNQPLMRQEQKVRQGLLTKGYASAIFDQIRDQVTPKEDPDEQAALLDKTAEKLWRRYRRYTGQKQVRHFKQGMFRRGFDLDRVQEWLDQHQEGLS